MEKTSWNQANAAVRTLLPNPSYKLFFSEIIGNTDAGRGFAFKVLVCASKAQKGKILLVLP